MDNKRTLLANRESCRRCMKRIVRYAYHEQASLQKASKIAAHEPQQNLLPQQNTPNLDMVCPYLLMHILELEFHTILGT